MRAASTSGDGLFQQAAAAVLLFESAGPNPAMDLLRVTGIVIVPFSIIAPFMGVLIDRIERRKILVWTPALRAAVAALIALTALRESSWLFMLAVLVILSLNRLFLATLSAVLPQLVPEEDLVVANASSSTAGAGANVVGQAVGAIVADLNSRLTAGLAGAAFLASGQLARELPVHRGLVVEPAPWRDEVRRVISESRDGFETMRRAPRVAKGMQAIALLQLLVGVLVAILLHFLVGELGLGPSSGFTMLAVLALGVGAGVLIVPIVIERLGAATTIRLAFVVGAIGCAIPAGSLDRFLMSLAAGLVGIAYALVKIPVDTIVQEDIADETRGRAFSVYDMLFNGARIAGTAVSAVAYELGLGTRAQTTIAAAGFLFVATQIRMPKRSSDHVAATERHGRPVEPPTLSGPIPVGSLVRIFAADGAQAEDEPRAILAEGREIGVELLWRGRETIGGRQRRVLGVAIGRHGLRLVADRASGGWEVTDAWSR